MSEALAPAVAGPPVAPTGPAGMALPAVTVDAGPVAVERFLEFFAASISNGRTRVAYGRAVGQFLTWCASRGLGLLAIAPLHVAAYIGTHPGSAPTVKQHLAAIRVPCDWLVVHQVLPVNPAAAVRGPKHVVTKGATLVLTPAETRSLLDGIDPGSLVGLRDRALLSVMVYSFARMSAVVGMRRQDYFRQGVSRGAGSRRRPQAGARPGPQRGRKTPPVASRCVLRPPRASRVLHGPPGRATARGSSGYMDTPEPVPRLVRSVWRRRTARRRRGAGDGAGLGGGDRGRIPCRRAGRPDKDAAGGGHAARHRAPARRGPRGGAAPGRRSGLRDRDRPDAGRPAGPSGAAGGGRRPPRRRPVAGPPPRS